MREGQQTVTSLVCRLLEEAGYGRLGEGGAWRDGGSQSLSLTVVVDKTSDCEQGEDPLDLLPCRLRCLGQV